MEMLIMVVDRCNPDSIFRDTKLYKRGMVVTIQEEGWNWGAGELRQPEFRIIKAGALDSDFMTSLLVEEDGCHVTDPATSTFQIRANKLDLDSPDLPDDFKAYIADDSRAAPYYLASPDPEPLAASAMTSALMATVDGAADPQSDVAPGEMTQGQLMAVKVALPPVSNPLVV